VDEKRPGRSVVVRLDGEGANWLYKPISFVPGVKVEYELNIQGAKGKVLNLAIPLAPRRPFPPKGP